MNQLSYQNYQLRKKPVFMQMPGMHQKKKYFVKVFGVSIQYPITYVQTSFHTPSGILKPHGTHLGFLPWRCSSQCCIAGSERVPPWHHLAAIHKRFCLCNLYQIMSSFCSRSLSNFIFLLWKIRICIICIKHLIFDPYKVSNISVYKRTPS